MPKPFDPAAAFRGEPMQDSEGKFARFIGVIKRDGGIVVEWDDGGVSILSASSLFHRDRRRRHRDDFPAGGAAVSGEWKFVPEMPTPQQHDGLARDIVMWSQMSARTGRSLHQHLRSLGRDIPPWMANVIPDYEHTPPKASVAIAIYRAMLDAAPGLPPQITLPTELDAKIAARWHELYESGEDKEQTNDR